MVDVLVFELASRRFAVELSSVQEVIPLGPITPLPAATPILVGAIHVRGQVMPLLNLGPMLGEQTSSTPPQRMSLLLRGAGQPFALCVDRLFEVTFLEKASLEGMGSSGEPLFRVSHPALGPLLLPRWQPILEEIISQISSLATSFGLASPMGFTPPAPFPSATGDSSGPEEKDSHWTVSSRQASSCPKNEAPPAPPAPRFDTAAVEADWDAETGRLLHELFLEEAQDHLEAIAEALFDSDPRHLDLEEILRRVHTLKGSSATVGLSTISEATHRFEEHVISRRGSTLPWTKPEIDWLLAGLDLLRQIIESAPVIDPDLLRRFTAHLQSGGPATASPRLDEAAASSTSERLASERRVSEGRAGSERRHEDQRLRVDVQHLDEMMSSVGELVIQRTRIERRVEQLKGLTKDLDLSRRDLGVSLVDLKSHEHEPAYLRLREVAEEVAEVVANLERTTGALKDDAEALSLTSRTLQERLSKVRMMPIHWLHARLQRPIKEQAASEGKKIELIIDDESSEMDRTVAEQIADSLIQLVRNAVAHGIETPATRRAAGKPEVGTIKISARHQGDQVLLEVEDDGAGISLPRLRVALDAWGKLAEEEIRALSDEQTLDFIFASGFSTRPKADRLAGRGVGLDIVRRNIANLGGSIWVSTQVDHGTRFIIQLPMTTAIAQALLFKVDNHTYAIPVAHIVETLDAEPVAFREQEGQPQVLSSAGWIPLLDLHLILFSRRAPALRQSPSFGKQPVIVLCLGSLRFGLTCSKVVGPREIVLKRLGPLLATLPIIAGATISGSGKVQFILDVVALARLVAVGRGPGPSREVSGNSPFGDHHLPPRILLADDSRSIRESVSHILKSAGYSVEEAVDGWEAWEKLKLEPYDLLLTDMEMPRLRGQELIDKCRNDLELSSLPIVVLTSRRTEFSAQTALERGANAFLGKPIKRHLVLQHIAELLQFKARRSSF